MSAVINKVRCAVYTRKSTKDGLDLDYNSIEAQRDAGHAFIASMRSEGCGASGSIGMSGVNLQKTGTPVVMQSSDGRVSLSIPIQFKRRSGRKQITLPNGETAAPRPWDTAATPLQLALVRGHRWLAMLESGEAKTLTEIAKREKIDNSYVSRMVNLTTLAPDIVEAIFQNTLPDHLTIFDLAVDPPALWDEQRLLLIGNQCHEKTA